MHFLILRARLTDFQVRMLRFKDLQWGVLALMRIIFCFQILQLLFTLTIVSPFSDHPTILSQVRLSQRQCSCLIQCFSSLELLLTFNEIVWWLSCILICKSHDLRLSLWFSNLWCQRISWKCWCSILETYRLVYSLVWVLDHIFLILYSLLLCLLEAIDKRKLLVTRIWL